MVAQPQVVSVVFVPNTPGSVLQKRLLELEPGLSAISGYRVWYMERSGNCCETVRNLECSQSKTFS